MEQKYKLKITGRSVCDVGYRPFLLVNAMNMGIKKLFAYNVKTEGQETVFVHISGDENKINIYIDFVKSNYPEHSDVDNIEVEEFECDITDTIEFLQLLQFKQINKGIPAILNIDKKQYNIINILKGVKGIQPS
jgi:acylphosphatase